MKYILLFFILSGTFFLGTCVNPPVFQPDTTLWEAKIEEGTSISGPIRDFTKVQGQRESRNGGVYTFYYWKQAVQPRGYVILAHGFLRRAENMAGWAEWLAGWGYEVAVPNFIHSSLLGGNHDKNAWDLRDLADWLWPARPRIYGGFSAGGLASFLAAAQDPRAQAWLGLDPVDSGNLAEQAVGPVIQRRLALLMIFAEPAPCNAQNNFLQTWQKANGSDEVVVRTRGTSHPAFEDPYDPSAEGLCGRMQPPEAVGSFQRWLKYQVRGWLSTLDAD